MNGRITKTKDRMDVREKFLKEFAKKYGNDAIKCFIDNFLDLDACFERDWSISHVIHIVSSCFVLNF